MGVRKGREEEDRRDRRGVLVQDVCNGESSAGVSGPVGAVEESQTTEG